MARIACVAPAFNEETHIGATVSAVPGDLVHTTIVVDDGSTDRTAERAAAAGATVLRHDRNRGAGAAIRTGMAFALAEGHDVVVVVSGGGKTPPAQIPELLAPLATGEVDLVQGSRYADGGTATNMPPVRRIGTRVYSLLFAGLTGHRIRDASSGFRACSARLLRDPRIDLAQPWLDRYELEPYLLIRALQLGYGVREVPIEIRYPGGPGAYSKLRTVTDHWRILRPIFLVGLRVRR